MKLLEIPTENEKTNEFCSKVAFEFEINEFLTIMYILKSIENDLITPNTAHNCIPAITTVMRPNL